MERQKLTKGKIIELLKSERDVEKHGKIKTKYAKRDQSKAQFAFSEELYRDHVQQQSSLQSSGS